MDKPEVLQIADAMLALGFGMVCSEEGNHSAYVRNNANGTLVDIIQRPDSMTIPTNWGDAVTITTYRIPRLWGRAPDFMHYNRGTTAPWCEPRTFHVGAIRTLKGEG